MPKILHPAKQTIAWTMKWKKFLSAATSPNFTHTTKSLQNVPYTQKFQYLYLLTEIILRLFTLALLLFTTVSQMNAKGEKSGSGLDPYSIKSEDLFPDSEYGSGFRILECKNYPQKWKKNLEISFIEVLDVLFWGLKASFVASPLWRPRDK